jgi:probable DNA metabolism protein
MSHAAAERQAAPAIGIPLAAPADFAEWRGKARNLLQAGVPPEGAVWLPPGTADLLGTAPPPAPPEGQPGAPQPRVSRQFMDLAEIAIRHRDPERFALLYRLLWRLQQAHGLIQDASDPDVARLAAMAKSVRRDAHKMHAFVRFREIATPDGPRFIAWFEPDHHILEAEAGFFLRRFAGMRWSILTPEASAHWDGETLAFGPGGSRADAPPEDAKEALWLTYYASIFNPARLKPGAMRAEMPEKYWKNLPEAAMIKPLMQSAQKRSEAMVARGPTPGLPLDRRQRGPEPVARKRASPKPGADEAGQLVDDIDDCRNCPLWENATRGVPGAGRIGAPLMFVGEQPGDEEDLAGKPFVGPAGRLFDKALAEAGVDRDAAYVTNAVKHFKFTPRGKRRIHEKPNGGEIAACRPFLARELALVRPKLVVALGATAAGSLIGKPVAVTKLRGQTLPGKDGLPVFITVHPSYLLRLPDPEAKAREYANFVADLRKAGAAVG